MSNKQEITVGVAYDAIYLNIAGIDWTIDLGEPEAAVQLADFLKQLGYPVKLEDWY